MTRTNELVSVADERQDSALIDASRLLAGADDVEIAFGAVVAILSRRMRLRRAALIENNDESTTILRWSSAPSAPSAATVGAVHTYFTAPAFTRSGAALRGHDPQSISVPLALPGQPVFATLQVVAERAVDRGDVAFVCAVAAMLARSLDACRAFSLAAAPVRRAVIDRQEPLLDHLDGAFAWEAEGTGQVTYLSAGVEALLGHTRASWFADAQAWTSVVHADDRPLFDAMVGSALETRRAQRCEHRCVASDGTVRWLHTSVHVIELESGRLLRGVSVDITDAKRAASDAEERLLEERGFSHAMSATLGVVAVDSSGRLTVVNAAAAAALGWRPEDAGSDADAFVTLRCSDGSAVPSPLRAAITSGRINSNEDHVLVRRDRPSLPVHYTVSPIVRAGHVVGAVFTFEDITHRRENEEIHLFLLESSRVLSSGLDYTSALRRLARLAVPRLGDLCFIDLHDPDGQPRRVAFAHRDPVQDAFINDLFADCPVVAAVDEGLFAADSDASWPLRTAALGPVGVDPLRSLLTVAIRLGDESLGMLSCVFSTSHRRHRATELYIAEELARRMALALENGRLFEQSRKAVAQREQILAVVSHDLKNPLSAILIATSMLHDENASAEHGLILRRIESASARMARMIDDLLDFASIDAGHLAVQRAPHDGLALLQETVASFAATARRRAIQIDVEMSQAMPPIDCDRGRALQVLGNLVGNALKVSADGARIKLQVRPELQPNGTVVAVFTVADSGPGIALDDLPRLFDRYWRSDNVTYRGHGLGLAIARGIVRAHGGRIWATSVLGAGASFHFTMPLASAVH